MKKATASGLNVKSATSMGLEVSFDDINYSYNISDPLEKQFPLISSGDGQNFFIPLLNRSTGEPILSSSDGKYQSKRAAEANQDYYETDLWFRSNEKLDINLRNDSKISPKDINDNERKSTFGNFSEDYIAGAARVAFFNVDANGDETLNNIWIPNKNYELSNQSNFSPIEIYTDGGGELSSDPDDTFGLNDTSKYEKANLWIWEGHAVKNNSEINKLKDPRQIYLNKADGIYYGAIDVESSLELDHYINITNSNKYENKDTELIGSKSDEKSLSNYEFNNVTYNYIGAYLDEHRYNITVNNNDSVQWGKLNVDADPHKELFFNSIDRFQILFSYNNNTNKFMVIDFVFYNSKSGEVGGGTGGFGGDNKYYKLETNKSVVLTGTNDTGLYALSAASNNVSAKRISSEIVDSLPYVDSQYLFSVEAGSSEGLYKLKSTAEQKYLSVSSEGKISLSETPSVFSVVVGSDSKGNDVPVLKCNSFYIIFNGTDFTTSAELISATNIYQGNSFSFTDNGNAESNYTYITSDLSSPTPLAAGKYFTDISDAPTIASLSEIDQSGYYKAHIKVRIWVEGTDREAKTPLAGGIFKNLLVFEGQKTEEKT